MPQGLDFWDVDRTYDERMSWTFADLKEKFPEFFQPSTIPVVVKPGTEYLSNKSDV